MVLVASPGAPPREIRARFGVRTTDEIEDLPGESGAGRSRSLPGQVICREHPVRWRSGANEFQIYGGAADLDWLQQVSSAFPRLGARDGWAAEFGRELNATEDRASFGNARIAPSSMASTSARSWLTSMHPTAGSRSWRLDDGCRIAGS
jgi:hypothetical protein